MGLVYDPIRQEFVEVADEVIAKAPLRARGTVDPFGATGVPPIATGQAPPSKRAAGGGGTFRDFLPILIAGLGDLAASGFTGKPTTAALSSTLQLSELAEKRKERQGTQELALLKEARAVQQEKRADSTAQFAQLEKLVSLGIVDNLDPDAKARLIEANITRAKTQGVTDFDQTVEAMLQDPKIGREIIELQPYLDDTTADLRTFAVIRRTKGIEAAMAYAVDRALPFVGASLQNRARLFKRSNPQGTFDEFLDSLPPAATVERQTLAGTLPHATQDKLDRIRTSLGFITPEITEKARTAGAVKAAEITAAQALKGPELSGPVKERLSLLGVKDVTKLNPENPRDLALMNAAQQIEESRSLGQAGAHAEAVARAQARVKAGEPLDTKERANLANAYRTQARLQIESQHKGEFGAILLTDEQRKQFEQRIETRTRELATADGLHDAIFPKAKPSQKPTASKDRAPLSRKDPDYLRAKAKPPQGLGLSDAEIEKRFNIRLVD